MTFFEKIVFNDAVAGRKAESAEAELQCFRAIYTTLVFEIMKVIVVNPQSLGDLASLAADSNKFSDGILVLKSVMINLMIVAANSEVIAFAGRFKNIPGPPTKAGAAVGFGMFGGVGELKALDDDIHRGRPQAETAIARNFRVADFFSSDRNRPGFCSLAVDYNILGSGINSRR